MKFIKKIFDNNMKSLIKNSSILLSGSLSANILGIFSLIIVARAIGPNDLGILTLTQTYILLIAAVLLPKPWITIVRYGTGFLEKKEYNYFKTLIKYGFIIEVLASVFALILTFMVLNIFFLDKEIYLYISIYSFILLFNMSGTGTGILRVYDKFKTLSLIEFSGALLKLILVSTFWVLDKQLVYFVLSYLFGEILIHVLKLILGFNIILKEKIFGYKSYSFNQLSNKEPTFSKFLFSTHLNDILGTSRRNLDFLVIGALLSNEMVGFYRVIKQFGKVFSLLGNPIKKTLYPECCRFWEKNSFANLKGFLMKITALMLVAFTGSIGLFAFFANNFLEIFFGHEYTFIAIPLTIYLIGHGVFLSFQTLNSLLLSMGEATKVLYVELITNIIYFSSLLLLINSSGLYGVVFSFVISVVVWIIMSFWWANKKFNHHIYKNKTMEEF